MIEVAIPKDVRRYKAKVVGPFTLRQLICAIVAGAIAYIVWKVCKSFGAQTVEDALGPILIAMIPALAIGWIEPYGMPFEVFALTTMISIVLAPKHRVYITENKYKNLLKQIDEEEKKLIEERNRLLKIKIKKKKKKPSTSKNPRKKPNKNSHLYGYI